MTTCKIEVRFTGLKEAVMRTVEYFEQQGMMSDFAIKARPSGVIQAYGTITLVDISDKKRSIA